MIKNIVFDMGDVLLRYEPYQPCLRHARGDKEIAAQLMAGIFDHKDWELADGGMLTLEEQTYRAVKRISDPRARGEGFSILRDWRLDGLWPSAHCISRGGRCTFFPTPACATRNSSARS